MANLIENKFYVDPIKKAITKKAFKEYFGEPKLIEDVQTRILIYAKMALLSVNLELEKHLPRFYSMKESYIGDLSLSEDEFRKLFEIKVTDNVKPEYFDKLLADINSIIDEYKLLKNNNKVKCTKERLIKFRDLIERYASVVKSVKKDIEPVKTNVEKNKGGRPKLSDDMKRKNKVILYFNNEELANIKNKAGRSSLSVYIKNKVLY